MPAARELETLLNRYIDGTADAADVARLDALLREDETARRDYAERMNVESALAACAADWAAEQEERVAAPRPEPGRIAALAPVWRGLAAAACVALAALPVWRMDVSPRAFATVVNAIGTPEVSIGRGLRDEGVEIGSGTVELLTARGARVVVEAPASFRFEAVQTLRVAHGRVAAQVPPAAQGFTVLTPTGRAVDLGTQFGVDVPRHGAAEIHVFEGEVIAESAAGGARQSLRDGEAFTLQSGAGAAREMRSAAFIRPDEMAGLSAALAAGQRARAEAAVRRLRGDPALIALLDFEDGVPAAGTFRTVQGRWPGTRAPEFVQVGDHMKLDVGGDRGWPQFSLAAWVRIDRLGEPYQSLYHTDGWYGGDKPGQVHWMINRNMTMRLALRDNTLAAPSPTRTEFPDSRLSVQPEQGRWMHLAVVYDAPARTVRFFLNGRFDSEVRQQIARPARFGPAQIGNWDAKDRKLSGRIDELLILGRALADGEVSALYEAGNPYR